MINKTFLPSRRDFLKTAGIVLPAMGMGSITFPACSPERKTSSDELFGYFQDPAPEARPFFRWWWNGNQVEKEEIAREIRLMKNAGAGGIEINPIAMPQQIEDSPRNGLAWLSDAWCEMVRYAVEEAGKNNMVVDLIVGTGWPFGGEFLDPDETIRGLTFELHEVQGAGEKSLTLREPEENEEIYKIYLIPAGIKDIEDVIALEERTDAENQLAINVPDNDCQVVVIRIKKGFREVFRGAPGGAGPVLDHFNAGAVSKYLNHMSDALNPYFDGKLGNGLRAMFCDSIELEGANWTTDLPEEFEKRRGYPLPPYLPLLFSEITVDPEFSGVVERARYDYSLTLAELFRERFIEVFNDWCHGQNVLSRYQAYGHPWLYTDLVVGNMIPDIPEGDQWLFNPGWSSSRIDDIRYAIWNKYASSGGHLAQKPIISSEAMTNTSGVFKATLKYMKQAADLNFLAGINHLVLHGFNYSPPEIGFPGWVQYGTYFNENNPWWPYVSNFMDYASRISAILQKCEPVSQVAILGPTPDVWRKNGLDRNPFNTEPWYLHSLWQAFSSQGISVDYINGEVFTGSTFQNKNFGYGKMSYQALVVVNAVSMEMPVARSILQYVETGGRVIFIAGLPTVSPGMDSYREFNELVKSSIEDAIAAGAQVEEPPDESFQGDLDRLALWAGDFLEKYQLKPGFRISRPNGHLMTAQFSHNRHPVVFISNVHQSNTLEAGIVFPENKASFWQWDTETMNRKHLIPEKNGTFQLKLKPLESILIIGDHALAKQREPRPEIRGREWSVDGVWEIECIHKITGENLTKRLDRLVDLSTLPDLQDFSGTVIYRKSFDLEDPDYAELELGSIHDLAEVVINGKTIGVDWYGNKTFSLNGSLIRGNNELEIRVVNTLLNYCISRRNDPGIAYWLDRYREKPEIAPTGLMGPVKFSG
ncbi:MAG: hypothetical protein KFF73_08845 [Cyclobacteriaceae bacterium]|nr:hypothetical protein [Cyclobacteriaceae bacterium]